MNDLDQLEELLVRWQDLCEQGLRPTAAEVCADCPELAGAFESRLHGMERLADFLGIDSSTVGHEWLDGETPKATDSRPDLLALAGADGSARGPASAERQTSLSFLDPPDAPDCLGLLGPYRVLEVLGEGGMGLVLKAEELRPRRLVAVKVVRPDLATPQARQRFLREGQALASVEHERIVPVYRVDELRGVPYLVMPLLQGESLRARLKSRGAGSGSLAAAPGDGDVSKSAFMPLDELLRIGREIAEGLAAAHAAGLIHRDVKPANIWLRGADRRVVLLDFGLARVTPGDGDDGATLTGVGAVVGTPDYMAPEQATGQPVDARADLFSLGCVLYELAAGRRPFAGPNPLAVLAALANHHPPPPVELRPDVPAALCELIMRLLAKSPGDRPQSAAEVGGALRAIEQARDVAATIELPIAGSGAVAPDSRLGVSPAEVANGMSSQVAERHAKEAPARARKLRLMIGCGGLLTISITATAAVALIAWIPGYRQVARHTPVLDSKAANPEQAVSSTAARTRQPPPSPPLQEHALPNAAATPQPAPAPPAPVSDLAPLRVVSIDVRHYARSGDDEVEPKGILGKQSFAPRVGDQVTIEARLSRPAYAYLLACRPDGVVELCFPNDEPQPPKLTDAPRYPPPDKPDTRYGLKEGEGLWVFAVVASEQPLPSFRDFISRHAPVWSPRDAEAGVVWWYDGRSIEALVAGGHTRAKGEAALGSSAAVTSTANWLKLAADGAATAALAFEVDSSE